MNHTEQELMKQIEEEDVKFIRLSFCDIYGVQKNISIQRSELPRAFEKGIGIDASYINGFGGDYGKDIWLHPETDTITVLPWRPEHGKVVRMFCTLTYEDGTPVETDTRAMLKNAVKYAQSKGYRFHFKSELQFYLFKMDADGENTGVPYDSASYMDIAPLDKGENVRREVCLTLEQMGIDPESSHHEAGPGQNEIDFRYADPITAADNTVTFLSVVRTIAARNGLYADFSPKPIKDKTGSALHISVSTKAKTGEDVTDASIAGILHNIAGMTVFLNPKKESFERFGKHKAPKYITWSQTNRSQLIFARYTENGNRCAQLRSPDPEANPYLAYALMIYAIMDGIENNRTLPQPTDESVAPFVSTDTAEPQKLPDSLEKARIEAANSPLVQQFIPSAITRIYCAE